MNHRGTETPRDPLSERVIGCAIEVHRNLGPGLLESAYEECLCWELAQAGLAFARYLRLSGLRKGLLLNFNTPVLKDGIRRMVL